MARDQERRTLVQASLAAAGVDALVCALPANVLLVSGYWPVVGTSIAVVVRDGPTVVLVPQDEEDIARHGGADEVRTFEAASLEKVQTLEGALLEPLTRLARDLGLEHKRIAHERGSTYECASYAEMHLYQATLPELLEDAFARPELVCADALLIGLRARKTAHEVSRLRLACRIAAEAFEQGKAQLRAGLRETEAANGFHFLLAPNGTGREGVQRAGGSTFCMSGPNAALAARAYARSRDRRLAGGDLVMIHCNSFADGYWTDITRTYCLGKADKRQQELHEAVFAARAAALAAIKPGVKAADVDHAAREVLRQRGLGKQFKHPTGHGVGFSAISQQARPRLHPHSPDVLEVGMVFNVEPAVYLEDYGGVRHCDVVTVTAQGAEVLTPFHADLAQLQIG